MRCRVLSGWTSGVLPVLLAEEPDTEAWTVATALAWSGGTYLQMQEYKVRSSTYMHTTLFFLLLTDVQLFTPRTLTTVLIKHVFSELFQRGWQSPDYNNNDNDRWITFRAIENTANQNLSGQDAVQSVPP